MSWCVICILEFTFQILSFPSSSLPPSPLSSSPFHFSSLYLGPIHLVCPSLCSLNLNYTWTKDEYTFDYYVGVCVAPVSTALDDCYVVQKTTTPDGEITFQCLGGNLDVQVTKTQSAYNLCNVHFTPFVMGTYIIVDTCYFISL